MDAMHNNKITSKQLVELYLQRIDQVNLKGPSLHALIETNPDALTIAHRLDHERNRRGKLHGIPIIVKDNMATYDKLNTTAGSYALLGSKVSRDAFVVQQLRKAGAIILGKASLSEWSNFRSLVVPRNGVSGRGGVSKSAYVTDGDPSGSSSGSAIAVSIGLCTVALGTETDGSVVAPASRNGIVGLKPTVGLTSRSNVIPISFRQDTVGPMGKTVTDVALLLEVIQGVDPRDNATLKSRPEKTYTQFLRGTKGFKNVRLGVIPPFNFTNKTAPYIVSTFNKAIELMCSYGAIVQNPVNFTNMDQLLNSTTELDVLIAEFRQNINNYLSTLTNTKMHTLQDLINFNNAHKDLEFSPYLPDQQLFILSQEAPPLSIEREAEYIRLSKSLNQTMDIYNLDALVAMSEDYASLAAVGGYPIISVPLGYLQTAGGPQPFGIQFMGRAWSEGILLQLAHAFEQATHVRDKVRPIYAPS
ncbi:unnamed protein product [Rotaria sordida]|uniref:Amidase domain-containing protein n=2 Tax=Rotaria sordida TaxID=392033 RepID=A0A814WLE4_9BILA|nr:unnamed protein product [Rotaria sordida]